MTASTTIPLVYRINVAEAKLGVSRSTIYRLIKSGELKQVKIGKKASGVTADSVHAIVAGGGSENLTPVNVAQRAAGEVLLPAGVSRTVVRFVR